MAVTEQQLKNTRIDGVNESNGDVRITVVEPPVEGEGEVTKTLVIPDTTLAELSLEEGA